MATYLAQRSLALLSALLRRLIAPLPAAHPPPDPRPAVSFAGCGFLYPYQLGVAAHLAAHYDVSQLRCAGHSAGFAAALSLAAGVPPSAHWDVLQVAQARWAARPLGPFLDSTRAWMAPYLAALRPCEPAIAAAGAAGRLCLGYSRLEVGPRWRLRGGHATTAAFPTLRAFVYAVTLSQRCPPFYTRPGFLDGGWGADGALTAAFTLPPGCAAARCVTVSPTNTGADVCPSAPLPLAWFFTPPDAARWALLMEMGARDAAAARATLVGRGLVPLRRGRVASPRRRR